MKRVRPCRYCQKICHGNCDEAKRRREAVAHDSIEQHRKAAEQDQYGFRKALQSLTQEEMDRLTKNLFV